MTKLACLNFTPCVKTKRNVAKDCVEPPMKTTPDYQKLIKLNVAADTHTAEYFRHFLIKHGVTSQ